MGLYGATKFAVDAVTESYRFELTQLGVDVVLVQPSAYPTNLYSALQQAADLGRAKEYGDVAGVPGEIVKYLTSVFTGKDAPDSHDVAKALVKLVATPAGKRPQRVIVGAPYGADAANEALAPIQVGVVKAMGMEGLTALKVGS
jgi:NAD(P)-dependent dehydrogenase (short-subunit alcohol dehydrogenase family)